jgi:menaquinone-dependent protoporphyrinogen oxidase
MVVLVVFATRYGSTREVAEAVGEEIGRVLEVSVRDAADLVSFDGADAVVLGSAIYGGHWLEPARKLVDDHARELAARPTWLFSVGPIGDPPEPEEAGPDGISETLDATGARGHQVFAGKLDYWQLRRIERLMVKALHAPEGDFRGWVSIRAWAKSIASELASASDSVR